MSKSRFAKWSAPFLVIALLCLTSCATFSSDRWKQRVLSCRQVPAIVIEDAPTEFLACPAAHAAQSGNLRELLRDDKIEWGCIEGL